MSENRENKVIKAGAGYTIGNFLIRGLTFLTVSVYTRIMTQHDFGEYSTFTSFEAIFSMLIGMAIHTSYKNAKYKYGKDYNKYVTSTVYLLIISTLSFLLLMNVLYLTKVLTLGFDLINTNALILYSASTALIMCYNSYVALEYEYQSYLKVAAANAIGNTVLSVLLILTVFKGNTLLGRVLGTTIPSALIGLYIIRYLCKDRDFRFPATLDFWKWGLIFSLPIIPHGLSQVVLGQFGQIMIRDMIGSEQAAIFGFAYTIYLVVSVVVTSLTGVWEPWFYEQMSQDNRDKIRDVTRMFTLVMFAFCVCYMFVSPEVIRIFGPEKYSDSSYCAIPVIASGFFVFLFTFPSGIEYYHEKTRQIAVCTVIAAVTNVVLNYLLIPRYGYVAAAYTTLVTYILYFLLHYFIAAGIQKELLFDNKVFFVCGILMIAVMFVCLFMIKMTVVRWLIALALFVITVVYVHKAIDLVKFIKAMVNRNQ